MAVVQNQRKGTIVDSANLTIYDTRELEWERMGQWDEVKGLVGAARKNLIFDDDGYPLVNMTYMPVGFSLPKLPYRHLHRTVHEYIFGLWGELPHWEYESFDAPGTLYTRKAWHYGHRYPGSIHGLEAAEPQTKVGAFAIEWRSGRGALLNDPGVDDETQELDYPPDWKHDPNQQSVTLTNAGQPMLVDWGDLKKIDTLAMAWEPLPGLDGAYQKILDRDPDGWVYARLTYLPAGFKWPELPYRHYHRTVTECSYIVGGELVMWEYENADQQQGQEIRHKDGYFTCRRPGSIHGYEAGRTSDTGAIILSWRTGPGTVIGEAGFDDETVSVPYA
jgi:hypothetical protein